MSDETTDQFLQRVAGGDQAQAAARDSASMMVVYFNSLRRGGMTRGEALELTRDYQVALVEAAAVAQCGCCHANGEDEQ